MAYAIENRLESIIIALRNGVELVVVAASAVGGQADKCLADGAEHIFEFFLANSQAKQRAYRTGACFVPRTGDKKARGHDAVASRAGEHVAGNLLADELVVRLVLVEALNDVIAIAPRVIADLVAFEALTLREPSHVEPVSSPALAITRRGQQSINQLLICIWRLVFQEGVQFLGRGREAMQVIGSAADQRGAIGGRRHRQAFAFELGDNKGIDRVDDW